MDYLEDFLKQLLSLGPEALTVVIVICLGYVARVIPKYRNDWIPVGVVVAGTLIYPMLVSPGAAPPDVRFPVVRELGLGLVCGVGGYFLHDKFIKRIERRLLPWLGEKFPMLKTLLGNGDTERIEHNGPDT